jgi:hypothetical protein
MYITIENEKQNATIQDHVLHVPVCVVLYIDHVYCLNCLFKFGPIFF